MNPVEAVISTQGIYSISRRIASRSAPGTLGTSRQAPARALGSTGFVGVLGQLRENFKTYLNRKPFEIAVGDLKPSTLRQFVTWLADMLATDPDRAERTQAHIRPEMAIRLLK